MFRKGNSGVNSDPKNGEEERVVESEEVKMVVSLMGIHRKEEGLHSSRDREREGPRGQVLSIKRTADGDE